MKKHLVNIARIVTVSAASVCMLTLWGCGVAPLIGGALSAGAKVGGDALSAKKIDPTDTFSTAAAPTKLFTAAVQAASSSGGKVTVTDRESGLINFQFGSFDVSVVITEAGKGSKMALDYKYVSGRTTANSSSKEIAQILSERTEANLKMPLTRVVGAAPVAAAAPPEVRPAAKADDGRCVNGVMTAKGYGFLDSLKDAVGMGPATTGSCK